MSSREPPTGAPNPEPASAHAFGVPPEPGRWPGSRLRLALLCACLAAAVAGLVKARGYSLWLDIAGGNPAASAHVAVSVPACPGRSAPQARAVPLSRLAALRGLAAPLMPRDVGREYEAGPITTANLWSDDEPGPPGPLVGTALVPAAYETRWWALDGEGREDDIAVDALELGGAREASRALALASDAHCRRGGVAWMAPFPAGAVDVFWVNPDRVAEWDAMLVRGRRLFRVTDVPPDYPTGPRADRARGALASATIDALACHLPAAGCSRSQASLGRTSFAVLPQPRQLAAAGPPTRAEAVAYAKAVNLPSYDVSHLTRVAAAGPTDGDSPWEALARCAGAGGAPGAAVAIHSPVFQVRSRGAHDAVFSTVFVFARERSAARYVALLGGERARRCAAKGSPALWFGVGARAQLGRSRVLAALAPAFRPASYRGTWRFHAAGLRLLVLPRGHASESGRHVAIGFRLVRHGASLPPVYVNGLAFAYGRAVVALTTLSAPRPYPRDWQRFLEATLVGRAEAKAFDLIAR